MIHELYLEPYNFIVFLSIFGFLGVKLKLTLIKFFLHIHGATVTHQLIELFMRCVLRNFGVK